MLQCQFSTHSFFGCKPSELNAIHPITPEDCWKAVHTGTFKNSEFSTDNLVVNRAKSKVYYSHGHLDAKHWCEVANFRRNDENFTKSYEETIATFTITQLSLQTEYGKVSASNTDVLLPMSVRMPAEKLVSSTLPNSH